MKYREKIVQMEFLYDEERVIRRLQAVYNQSLKDITQKANALQEEINKKLAAIGFPLPTVEK